MLLLVNSDVRSTGFRMVPHRANRKLGIPIVFRDTTGGDLRKTSPWVLYNDIFKAAGEVLFQEVFGKGS